MKNRQQDSYEKYFILKAPTVKDLEDNVRYWLKIGYEPLGAPFATDNNFYQAVVKIERN